MFALEETHSSRPGPLRAAVAVASAVALAGVSAIALRHGPSPKPEVLVPQTTTSVICGQTITVSIVVGNDLTCGSGNGLNAGHATITINLNGHTLTGNVGSRGVDAHGFSAVTITNGTVAGWNHGVFADGAADKVTAIRAPSNNNGIVLEGTGASATGNVAFQSSNRGIILDGFGEKATSNVVRESSGIGIEAGTGSVVQTNQSLNNGSHGIFDGGSGATLTGNVTNGNAGDGIDSHIDQSATIASNIANYNGAYGIEGSPGGKDGGGNTAKANAQATQCKDVVCA